MKTYTIFFVDDDPDDLQNLRDAHASLHLPDEVCFFQSVEGMLQKLPSIGNTPDLIVLDHQTPGMKGDTAVELLRRENRFAETTLVVYSSHLGKDLEEHLRCKGADLCKEKGMLMDDLVSDLKTFRASMEKKKAINRS